MMTVRTKMMMMMATMMTCFWAPNLLNLHHFYPTFMMSNHWTIILQTFPVKGEIQTYLSPIMMLNTHPEHEPRLTDSPSTPGPTHPLSDLQPRHSSLVLVSTAPMIYNLPWNPSTLGTLWISIQTQPSSPLETLPHGNPTSFENSNDLTCSPNLWTLIQTPTSGAVKKQASRPEQR